MAEQETEKKPPNIEQEPDSPMRMEAPLQVVASKLFQQLERDQADLARQLAHQLAESQAESQKQRWRKGIWFHITLWVPMILVLIICGWLLEYKKTDRKEISIEKAYQQGKVELLLTAMNQLGLKDQRPTGGGCDALAFLYYLIKTDRVLRQLLWFESKKLNAISPDPRVTNIIISSKKDLEQELQLQHQVKAALCSANCPICNEPQVLE